MPGSTPIRLPTSTPNTDHTPQQADQHRLVHHVEAEAPAAEHGERRERARHGAGEQRGPVREQPVGRRRAPPDDAEPGQDRRVVFGDRQVRDEADPVGPARVEERIARQARQRDRDQAERPAPGAPRGREADDDEHHGDAVQHAEADEAARKHQPRAERDEHRAAGDLRPAPPEARHDWSLRRGDALAGADAGHEQRDDAGALHRPDRVCDGSPGG